MDELLAVVRDSQLGSFHCVGHVVHVQRQFSVGRLVRVGEEPAAAAVLHRGLESAVRMTSLRARLRLLAKVSCREIKMIQMAFMFVRGFVLGCVHVMNLELVGAALTDLRYCLLVGQFYRFV